MYIFKNVGKNFQTNIRWVRLVLCATRSHMQKKSFGTGTKQYAALLALASVFYFYLPRTFITWSNQAQVFKANKLWHFLF